MLTALLIIAQEGFQDRELGGTRTGLLDAGFSVELASKDAGLCTGKFGGQETARYALRDVRIDDFDRIAFIGGPGASGFVENEDAHRIAREALLAGKPLGAICIAPLILAAAGVLHAKRATVWDDGEGTQQRFLRQYGAIYSDEAVAVDGLIVTANGPEAAEEFGKALAAL